MSPKLELSRIVFIGRTWDEYMLMFNLVKDEVIGRKILDCPAGACSFTAVSNRLGADVTAIDIAYDHPAAVLEQKGKQDIAHTMQQMVNVQRNYNWSHFGSIEGLRRTRQQALLDCSEDMLHNPHRYVPAALPLLPFEDEQFDLTLSAHFLFLYADQLDYAYHLSTIKEMMRVTKSEIRIFPTVDMAGNRYEHMDQFRQDVQQLGWAADEIKVPYEFLQNANLMLKLQRQ
ncbi:MAG: hypothetical protein JWN30_798 [Bacilli bacterium]|nr:hypothetical protein [Bacilli bacterium]